MGNPFEGFAQILMPKDILIKEGTNPLIAIVESTYPDLVYHLLDYAYFTERAILSCTVAVIDEINELMGYDI